MNALVKSNLENAFRDFLKGVNITDVGQNVFRYLEVTQSSTPCIFVVADTPQETTPGSNRYKVPISIRIVQTIDEAKEDTGSLDRYGLAVETALTASFDSINSTNSNIFMYKLTKPSSGQEIVEHTFQYAVNLETVCKAK
jgi:hypothetical protein